MSYLGPEDEDEIDEDPQGDETGEETTDPAEDNESAAAEPDQLSPEELARLAADPAVIDRVLSGESGQAAVDRLLNTIFEDDNPKVAPLVDRAVERREVQRAERATAEEHEKAMEDLVKRADEDDPDALEELGKITREQIRKARVEAPVRAQISQELDKSFELEFSEGMDTLLSGLGYASVVPALTDADRAQLARSRYPSRVAWTNAVANKIREVAMRTNGSSDAEEEDKAQRRADKAGKLRNGRVPVLPGGRPTEAKASMTAREWIMSDATDDDD